MKEENLPMGLSVNAWDSILRHLSGSDIVRLSLVSLSFKSLKNFPFAALRKIELRLYSLKREAASRLCSHPIFFVHRFRHEAALSWFKNEGIEELEVKKAISRDDYLLDFEEFSQGCPNIKHITINERFKNLDMLKNLSSMIIKDLPKEQQKRELEKIFKNGKMEEFDFICSSPKRKFFDVPIDALGKNCANVLRKIFITSKEGELQNLESLKECRNLTHLCFESLDGIAKDWIQIASHKLVTLETNHLIDDEDIQHLAKCENLKHFGMSNLDWSKRNALNFPSLVSIGKEWKRLESFSVEGYLNLRGYNVDLFEELLRGFPLLEGRVGKCKGDPFGWIFCRLLEAFAKLSW
eukprot:TRINITY_DN5681_c0_g1_i1.p1 TRINITY_DN5681_c0_g1~~TRINITY_DN5681_c0_g1_i1.p1  ORF type:complete len:352 (-),score=95.67 TRINITY_DN5681_c0_g1_i1:25-1080(-)